VEGRQVHENFKGSASYQCLGTTGLATEFSWVTKLSLSVAICLVLGTKSLRQHELRWLKSSLPGNKETLQSPCGPNYCTSAPQIFSIVQFKDWFNLFSALQKIRTSPVFQWRQCLLKERMFKTKHRAPSNLKVGISRPIKRLGNGQARGPPSLPSNVYRVKWPEREAVHFSSWTRGTILPLSHSFSWRGV
jgi:hypothetical protein